MIVHRALILCVLWTATQGQQIPHAICTETVVAPVNEGGVDLLNGSPDAGDDLTLSMTPQADAVFGNPGVHADEVKLTVTDSGGLHDTCTVPMVVVYENAGNGFVTGGGWIDSPGGAYQLDPDLTGKAHFGFNSKYQKRASVPTGETEFNFQEADLNFHSTEYIWLVLAGARARFRGKGTINGSGSYDFELGVVDGALDSEGTDKFCIKIWSVEGAVYEIGLDNKGNCEYAEKEIGGGNIKIHTNRRMLRATDH